MAPPRVPRGSGRRAISPSALITSMAGPHPVDAPVVARGRV